MSIEHYAHPMKDSPPYVSHCHSADCVLWAKGEDSNWGHVLLRPIAEFSILCLFKIGRHCYNWMLCFSQGIMLVQVILLSNSGEEMLVEYNDNDKVFDKNLALKLYLQCQSKLFSKMLRVTTACPLREILGS